MADPALGQRLSAASTHARGPRHMAVVRITHWITAACFAALLVSGAEIVISHPRFYWGEVGNVRTPSLFDVPIPSSRSAVKTGYSFVLPDQNGWSRSLHFQTAWLLVLTGVVYTTAGILTRHLSKNLLPRRYDLTPRALGGAISHHLRFKRPAAGGYNVLQRLTYLAVVFGLFPFVFWTGLAMSPAITSAWPAIVTVLGGQQSARTLHFFAAIAAVFFVLAHIVMIIRAGFQERMRAMITGHARKEEP
jgi:thiosulfate reductase cytochrome b subunit